MQFLRIPRLLRLSTIFHAQGDHRVESATMVQQSKIAAAAALLSASPAMAQSSSSFVCGGSGSSTSYNATSTYLGCYLDPHVSILGQAKGETIGMTPQYCANFCGSRGYGYGLLEFGT
jgi:beta-D-xylosidase 4